MTTSASPAHWPEVKVGLASPAPFRKRVPIWTRKPGRRTDSEPLAPEIRLNREPSEPLAPNMRYRRRDRNQSGYSSFRKVLASAGWAFGVRSSKKLKYGATNGSGADTV